MATCTFTIESSLTVDDAFDRLIDLTRVNEWDDGISGSTQVHGDGHVVGSRYEVSVTGFDGQPAIVIYELLEVDEPRRFVMEGANDVFCANDTIELAPSDAGCEVTYIAKLHLLGDDPPLTAQQLDSMFPKIVAVAEAGLQRYLNPPESHPDRVQT